MLRFSRFPPVVPHDFTSQCNQHSLIHSAGNQPAHQLSSVSLQILLLKNVTGFLCDDVLTFFKCTLSVAFAAYLCNHLFMLL